jgi:uncharacterized membrane protein SpoIIM required for sporulation
MIIRDRLARRLTKNYWQKFFSYFIMVVILLVVCIGGSFIEAYITPVFIKLVSSYMSA